MATDSRLHIALQDGFDGETVVVRVDGEEVYRRPDVVTDTRISLADSFEVPKPHTPVGVEVEVVEHGSRGSFTVEGEGTTYLGVSLGGGALRFRASSTPFGYA